MRTFMTCFMVLAGTLPLVAEEPVRLEFKTSGFSIEALEEQSEATVQVLAMTLPPTDGFAPNINVQVQPFAGTLDEYLTLSKTQLEQVKFKAVKAEVKEDQCVMEYTGTTQGRSLHFYAVAKKRGKKVILATATATQTQWPKVSEKLIRCVDSLKIDAAN